MQAERRLLGLVSFSLGLLAAVLLAAPAGDRAQCYVSACVCLALMLFFGLAWLVLAVIGLRGE